MAESGDVPGLVAEADSPNVLARKLRTLIPELLELNGSAVDPMATFHVRYQHEESVVLASSPITQRRFPVDRKILSRHTANAVLRQAGVAKQF